MKFIVLLLFSIINLSIHAQQVSFVERPVTEAGFGNPGLYAADFNGDGLKDIVATVKNQAAIKWWLNNGNDLVQWTEFTVANEPGLYVYAEDINGDNHIDILATLTNGQVAYWQNSGENPPEWEKITIATGFTSPHGIIACDIDNDDDNDIIATSAGLGKICWWEQDDTSWVEHEITAGFPATQSVYAVDIDNDDDIDVIGASSDADEISVWYNQGGTPISWEQQTIVSNFNLAHWVYACDIDDDGHIDILGAAFLSNEVAWWKNSGETPISWTKYTIEAGIAGVVTAHAEDLDNDGDMDVMATAWTADDVIWWENNGEDPIIWTKYTLDDFYNGAWPIYACDLDNDQDIDIITGADVINSGGTSSALTCWENKFYGANFTVEYTTGNSPYAASFTDLSNSIEPITAWFWDFDNDGTFDSYEQNPTWTYENPGTYSVFLEVQAGEEVISFLKEDYIHVFNGHTALEFNEQENHILC